MVKSLLDDEDVERHEGISRLVDGMVALRTQGGVLSAPMQEDTNTMSPPASILRCEHGAGLWALICTVSIRRSTGVV